MLTRIGNAMRYLFPALAIASFPTFVAAQPFVNPDIKCFVRFPDDTLIECAEIGVDPFDHPFYDEHTSPPDDPEIIILTPTPPPPPPPPPPQQCRDEEC